MQYPIVLFVIVANFLSGNDAQSRRFPYERVVGNVNDGNFVVEPSGLNSAVNQNSRAMSGSQRERILSGMQDSRGFMGNLNRRTLQVNPTSATMVGNQDPNNFANLQNLYLQSPQVPDCPLEMHPDTETMFIMRGPLGDPQPRTCPAGTYFLRSVCSCVNRPAMEKCNLRPSAIGTGWYEENVFGIWVQRPCGPGSAYSPATCECSITI